MALSNPQTIEETISQHTEVVEWLWLCVQGLQSDRPETRAHAMGWLSDVAADVVKLRPDVDAKWNEYFAALGAEDRAA